MIRALKLALGALLWGCVAPGPDEMPSPEDAPRVEVPVDVGPSFSGPPVTREVPHGTLGLETTAWNGHSSPFEPRDTLQIQTLLRSVLGRPLLHSDPSAGANGRSYPRRRPWSAARAVSDDPLEQFVDPPIFVGP